MNPYAIGLWTFSTALGYVLGDAHGAAIGLASSTGCSLALEFGVAILRLFRHR